MTFSRIIWSWLLTAAVVGAAEVVTIAPGPAMPVVPPGRPMDPHVSGQAAAQVPPLKDPRALVLDKDGNIYIVDSTNVMIYKLSPHGQLEVMAGTYLRSGAMDGPGAKALFHWPLGLAVDKDGNVYVADGDNNAVRKITPDGVVSTLLVTPLK